MVIYRVQPDGSVVEISNLYGPVVTDVQSEWWMGAEKGTNQTGEVCGVMQGLLWLLDTREKMTKTSFSAWTRFTQATSSRGIGRSIATLRWSERDRLY